MSYPPPLQSEELLRCDFDVRPPGRTPLRLRLTTQAASWPVGGRSARAPIPQIRTIRIDERRHVWFGLSVSALLLAFLVALTALGAGGTLLWLLALGFVFLRTLLEKERLTIRLETEGPNFAWTEPPYAAPGVAAEARAAAASLQQWASEVGVPFLDHRRA